MKIQNLPNDLGVGGFYSKDTDPATFESGRRELLDSAPMIELCKAWLKEQARTQKVNYSSPSSYFLKHAVEFATRNATALPTSIYTGNGALIAAAMILDIPTQRYNLRSPNAAIAIKGNPTNSIFWLDSQSPYARFAPLASADFKKFVGVDQWVPATIGASLGAALSEQIKAGYAVSDCNKTYPNAYYDHCMKRGLAYVRVCMRNRSQSYCSILVDMEPSRSEIGGAALHKIGQLLKGKAKRGTIGNHSIYLEAVPVDQAPMIIGAIKKILALPGHLEPTFDPAPENAGLFLDLDQWVVGSMGGWIKA